jgi:hypothetical protein
LRIHNVLMDSAKIVDSKPRLAEWAFLDQPV